MENLQACIFDLDGVLVDTAKYHYLAWAQLAQSLNIPFSETENEKLKGVSRMDSLHHILALGNIEMDTHQKKELANQKNKFYLSHIENMTQKEILAGVIPFLKMLQKHAIKIALGSASQNAQLILEKTQLYPYFQAIVDGNCVAHSKPNPEVFLLGCERLQCDPQNTVVFEDAPKGIEAALNGGMYAIGVGNPTVLGKAHRVISSFEKQDMSLFQELRK